MQQVKRGVHMRFSDFSGKEMIDLDNGEKMGVLGHSDLEIDPETGQIHSIILPATSLFGLGKKRGEIVIPWQAIRKVGPEMIIVEVREKGRARN
jgi:YlmC/YmxH family sporulation protein